MISCYFNPEKENEMKTLTTPDIPRRRFAGPAQGRDPVFSFRLPPALVARLDAASAGRGRSETARVAMDIGLGAMGKAPKRKSATSK
jgi:hypothetical protein